MSLPVWSILLAAGSGNRMGARDPKQYLQLDGEPLLLRSLRTFARHADPGRLILVIPAGDEERVKMLLSGFDLSPRLVIGGKTRQQSVWHAVQAITDPDALVVVHDTARPFFEGLQLAPWLNQLEAMGEKGALVPLLPISDTVLSTVDGRAGEVLDRENLGRVQTPQLFRLGLLRDAHRAALDRGETTASDDGSLILALGEELATVAGDAGNFKVTRAEDLARAELLLHGRLPGGGTQGEAQQMRSGIGYDSHRFDPERPLILGGVLVPSDIGGLAGHSDADVLTHAVIDALLGAAALGDIGAHFPDTDPRWRGAHSLKLLTAVVELLEGQNLQPAQVDVTVIAQEPKLQPYIKEMRQNLATVLKLPLSLVSVKATTNEGMGAIGRGEGMAAMAMANLKGKSA
jgi:2-C-methyl-D-erythritol 4-phosphate cytidylyltransferase / 2-C-methyl-D-erythritol 2,4-cyclodiphosphate synthase